MFSQIGFQNQNLHTGQATPRGIVLRSILCDNPEATSSLSWQTVVPPTPSRGIGTLVAGDTSRQSYPGQVFDGAFSLQCFPSSRDVTK